MVRKLRSLLSSLLILLTAFTSMICHGAGTASLGALITGEDIERAALSGAAGSVLTATFMDVLNDGVVERAAEQHLKGPDGVTPEARQRFLSAINAEGQLNAQIAGMASVLAAGLLRLDPHTAQQMSQLTAHNNCWPALVRLGLAVLTTYSLDDYFHTPRSGLLDPDMWVDAGLITLSFGGASVATKGAQLTNQGMRYVQSFFGRMVRTPVHKPILSESQMVRAAWQPQFWSRGTNYTFRGQTNKVYQRNDLIDLNRVDAKGRTSTELMRRGLAPIGPDGQSINLHHTLQRQGSPLTELTQTFHQEYSKVIHINPSTIPSGIDRIAFDQWRAEYWQTRLIELLGTK